MYDDEAKAYAEGQVSVDKERVQEAVSHEHEFVIDPENHDPFGPWCLICGRGRGSYLHLGFHTPKPVSEAGSRRARDAFREEAALTRAALDERDQREIRMRALESACRIYAHPLTRAEFGIQPEILETAEEFMAWITKDSNS